MFLLVLLAVRFAAVCRGVHEDNNETRGLKPSAAPLLDAPKPMPLLQGEQRKHHLRGVGRLMDAYRMHRHKHRNGFREVRGTTLCLTRVRVTSYKQVNDSVTE